MIPSRRIDRIFSKWICGQFVFNQIVGWGGRTTASRDSYVTVTHQKKKENKNKIRIRKRISFNHSEVLS